MALRVRLSYDNSVIAIKASDSKQEHEEELRACPRMLWEAASEVKANGK